MGFFAGELEHALRARTHANGSPWTLLTRASLHPQRIERLKRAAEDISLTTTLPPDVQQHLRRELDFSPMEWARLQAAHEADTFMRLFIDHHYPLEEAVNKANAVFASTLKDMLAASALTHDQGFAAALATPPPPRARRQSPRGTAREAVPVHADAHRHAEEDE